MPTAVPSPADLVEELCALAGVDVSSARLDLTGPAQVLPSSFRVDALAQAAVAAQGVSAAQLHRARGGAIQIVSVDARHATAEFRSERLLRVDGAEPKDPWDALAGVYRCADGRFVRLHTNFPHHRAGVVSLLGCADDKDAVARALSTWEAETFEAQASARGLVVAMARSFEEWDAHPHAAALAGLPPVEIERFADSPPRPLPRADRPLAGVRVLDLTRIIAGPVSTRILASHGAQVLSIASPALPSIPTLVIDAGRGKRQAWLDLRQPGDRAKLEALVREADVFVQGYRPGGLAALGFSPERLAELNPSIVAATLTAYGPRGPWAGKRGFDSLTQTATGLNLDEARAFGQDAPRALPCQALDHGAGHLLAFGVMAALARRAREGGAWRVETSLGQIGRLLRGLGRSAQGPSAPDPEPSAFAAFLEESDSAFGRLSAVRPAARLSATPPAYLRPAAPLGAGPAVWEAS